MCTYIEQYHNYVLETAGCFHSEQILTVIFYFCSKEDTSNLTTSSSILDGTTQQETSPLLPLESPLHGQELSYKVVDAEGVSTGNIFWSFQ